MLGRQKDQKKKKVRLRDRVRLPSSQQSHQFIPNMITVSSLCVGLTSIRFALAEQWEWAIAAVILAALLDLLDGRVAHLLKVSSRFGAELDSLADFANFGVVPALILYLKILRDLGGIGWSICLFYSVCCALRLARFNTAPPLSNIHFCGIPSPIGGLIALFPLVISFEWASFYPFLTLASCITLLFSGLMMISHIPTFSLKGLKINAKWLIPSLAIVGLILGGFMSHPWPTFLFLTVCYMISMVISTYLFYLQKRNSKDLVK